MSTSSIISSGMQPLRPRARLLHTLGSELISSDQIAIIELVKNAYDADATRVLVRFNGPLVEGAGSVEIIDNGHGMALETIQQAWMEPATAFKRRKKRSERFQRRVLGEKGVGRFAASRLAHELELVTKRAESEHEIWVFFDWRQYESDNTYLDEIESLWEITVPKEICPTGALASLWKIRGEIRPEEMDHGTLLRMSKLRVTWSEDKFKELRISLSRLISPFFDIDRISEKDSFQVDLQLPPSFEALSGRIEPPELIRHPHYLIEGKVNEDASYDLNIQLRGEEESKRYTGKFTLGNSAQGRRSHCGPFLINLRVWDRDPDSIRELASELNISYSDARRDLNEMVGISVFRDGFRVPPYGDPGNDWLRLDYRRIQSPAARLSNNQIVGYVRISGDTNPELRDKSDREGLIEGPALDDFRQLIRMVLSELEKRRYVHRQARKEPRSPRKGLFIGLDLAPVRDRVKKDHPEDTQLLDIIDSHERDLKHQVNEIQEVLARYQRLATLGKLVDIALHDGRTALARIINASDLVQDQIEGYEGEDNVFVRQLRGRLKNLDNNTKLLTAVFDRLEPFSGRKRGRPVTTYLERIIKDAVMIMEGEISRVGAKVHLSDTETLVTVDESEIKIVLINLLDNSLYWLMRVPKREREIAIYVRRLDEDEVHILFSDSGPGVDPDYRDYIFDPYISAKADGIGLGLTIAGEIVTYYDGQLQLMSSGPLPGATFNIILKKRV